MKYLVDVNINLMRYRQDLFFLTFKEILIPFNFKKVVISFWSQPGTHSQKVWQLRIVRSGCRKDMPFRDEVYL